MKSIVILSGKGGVGKSSISASLAVAFSKDNKIICADCDIDASNLALLFSLPSEKYIEWRSVSTNKNALIDKSKCIKCGKCIDTCYFDALKYEGEFPKVSNFGCEGCGACELICPVNAITMEDIYNAHVGYAKTNYGFDIVSAQLSPGHSGSGKVVSEVRRKVNKVSKGDEDYTLIDSAAGIGCAVIASVVGNDYAVLVTEPTPSGFSDMKKALKVVNHFRIKSGIIINKYDLNKTYTEKIECFAKENNLTIIKKIHFDKQFVKAMTEMIPLIDYEQKYQKVFLDIKSKIIEELNN